MSLIVYEAFKDLYPDREPPWEFHIKYSGKFSPYNATITYSREWMKFGLSRSWEGISKEIVMGLLQSLIVRALKDKKTKTTNMDLYHTFMKNVHISIPKDNVDPELQEAFESVNDKYFLGMVDMPNLQWGRESFSKFGEYDYGTDMITLSTVLQDHPELRDYVLYHEMLHKQHKFKESNLRTNHHSKQFRMAEKAFENAHQLEKDLQNLHRKKKRSSKSFIDWF